MENAKFSTVVKTNGSNEENDILYRSSNGYYPMYTRLANADKTSGDGIGLAANTEMIESTDIQLIKAWSHATIERKHGKYATKEALKSELELRGYVLSENGHRWKRSEIEA